MLRLTAVFFVWMASTAFALDDGDPDYDAELHANCGLFGDECYALMAQERAAELRYLTEANVRTILPAHGRADRSQDER